MAYVICAGQGRRNALSAALLKLPTATVLNNILGHDLAGFITHDMTHLNAGQPFAHARRAISSCGRANLDLCCNLSQALAGQVRDRLGSMETELYRVGQTDW